MKTLFSSLFLILFILLASCDGRDRVFKSNTEVLLENKLLDSFSENITYIPESYTEVVTDTILSNGFHIKMKTYSNMEQSVLNTFNRDTINHKEYYREFVSEVIITKDSKEIFNKKVDKQFLDTIIEDLQLNNAIVKLSLDESSSIEDNKVVLSAMIQKIDSKNIHFWDLVIHSEGTYKLQEVKELYAYSN
ncbi:hypothetical protein [Xanthomarina sp. GH4-25]|uniref:hypothetical protein n=1 Tax=Xanthomarina sp. GH4-25 TaxID=3349335 RepID=UPI000D675D15|nr:hypothetical protein DI383_12060 [Flavobacteriaceae bacterium LYZ1037]